MTLLAWDCLGVRRICGLNNVPRPSDIVNIRKALKPLVLGIE